MPAKKGPTVLILTLLFLLVFIGGIRYGQSIETTNKKTQVMLSLTPTQKPSTEPVSGVKVTFKTYSNKSCGISFLYPSTITLAKQSTDEARFAQGEDLALSVSCKKGAGLPEDMKKVTTSEAQFQSKTLKVQSYMVGGSHLVFFPVVHPTSGKTVNFLLDKDLYKLLETSLAFD